MTTRKEREFMVTTKAVVLIEHTDKQTRAQRFALHEIDGVTRSSTKQTGGLIIHTKKEGVEDHRLKCDSYELATELVKVL